MKLRLVKVVVLMLMAGLSGCSYRLSSESYQPFWQAKDLRINVECMSRNDLDCPINDPTVNGYAYNIPDPGHGPVTVEWLSDTPYTPAELAMTPDQRKAILNYPDKYIQHKVTVSVRRVRYWHQKQWEIVAKRKGYAGDKQYIAWLKPQFATLDSLTLIFLSGGKLVAEVSDTGAPLCFQPNAGYCPQDGIEE
jgi:hypothetical protein